MTNDAKVAVKLQCSRCYGTSIATFDDGESYRDARRWACPHCHEDDDAGGGRFDGQYTVQGVKVTTDFVDSSNEVDKDGVDAFEKLTSDVLTDTQEADFVAVEAHGQTCAGRARDRGVKRGTVTKTVARARRKIRATA